jgi:ubiquinone/menaquinone biosynthesis C-methylase UbiE
VLDIGCGVGDDIDALNRRFGAGVEVVGVERLEAFVHAGRDRHLGACVIGDAAELPFPDRRFDACRMDRVVQHLPSPQQALREAARVLRPAGRLVISEVTFDFPGTGPEDAEAMDEVLAPLRGPEGQAWMGTMLPALIRRAGFGTAVVESSRSETVSPQEAEICLMLTGREMSSRARRWAEAFLQGLAEGHRSLGLTAHHISATR